MSSLIKNLPAGQRNGLGRKKLLGKKLLILAAVILFAWLGLKSTKYSFSNNPTESYLASDEETIIEATDKSNEELDRGIFKNPLTALEQFFSNSAQGAIDFSADDEFEDEDLVFLQENSVVAANCPAPEGSFSNFRKEVVTHIVQSGENPEVIAISYGINTYTLLWANNLRDGDIIKPGQELVVLPINGVRIKVASGDTVDSLAKKYHGEASEIIAFNSLEGGVLQAGAYIIIPGGEIPALVKPKAAPVPKYASSVQRSGWLIIPTTGRNWGRIHAYNGVDVSNPCGTPIYAAAAGKVILSDGVGWNGGYGKYIKIQHSNGVITLYAHFSSLAVSTGQSVEQGQYIGAMGTTGRSTGCHLHFEVRGARNPLAR